MLPVWMQAETDDVPEALLPYVFVEESRTRVIFFSVYLDVGKVVLKDNKLLGVYKIRVPSSSSRNETGDIILELEETPLEEILKKGGTIRGKGISTNPKHPERTLVCEFHPDGKDDGSGKIRMTVDTVERVLRFDSTYTSVFPASN